jgi:hypothetical protein
MKKKIVSAVLVFAGILAFSPTDAHARPHHRRAHHWTDHTGHAHRVPWHASRQHHVTRRARVYARAAGGRPAAWCGWWLGHQLGIADRRLWSARNWASVGERTQPGVGVVVVWRHHVGIITGRQGSEWIVKSGNDGHVVRERPRSIAGAIAFRRLG